MRYLRGIITWIDSLESGSQFRQWAAILVKILGGVASVGISVSGIVICVNTIGASKDLEPFPIDLRGNVPFIPSVILFLIFVLSGIVLLIVAYFAAEKIDVQANIAESLNNIETKLVDEETTSDS